MKNSGSNKFYKSRITKFKWFFSRTCLTGAAWRRHQRPQYSQNKQPISSMILLKHPGTKRDRTTSAWRL